MARVVKLLVAAGADTEVRRKNGRTPLLEACANGNAACARELLKAGADVKATDNEGATAMMLAEATPKGAEAVKAVLLPCKGAESGASLVLGSGLCCLA